MPGQAATADVATAIYRWRNELIMAVNLKDRPAIVRAAQTFADILPDALKFKWVPYAEWKDLSRANRSVVCGGCQALVPTADGVLRHSPLPDADRLCLGLEEPPAREVWVCKACGHENRRGDRRLDFVVEPVAIVGADVYVPEPPPYHTVVDHALDHGRFAAWTELILRLIEDRMRRFRESYARQQGADGELIIEAEFSPEALGAVAEGAARAGAPAPVPEAA